MLHTVELHQDELVRHNGPCHLKITFNFEKKRGMPLGQKVMCDTHRQHKIPRDGEEFHSREAYVVRRHLRKKSRDLEIEIYRMRISHGVHSKCRMQIPETRINSLLLSN